MASLRSSPVPLPDPGRSPAPGGTNLFHAAPRAEHAALYPAWLAALNRIEGALDHPGVVALVGPGGTGRTLLLQQVAQRARAAGRDVALLNDPAGLRRGLPGNPDVILIDDADRLPAPLLTALARHGRPVLLVSGPALVGTLRAEGLQPTVVEMTLLSWEAAAAFLSVQLADARQPANLIQPPALVRLYERSGGHPRSLQMLAGLAVFVARLADSPQVTPAHVEQAALIQAGTDDDEEPEADLPAPDRAPDLARLGAPRLPVAPPRPDTRRRWSAGFALLGFLGAAGLCGGALLLSGWPVPASWTGPAVPPAARVDAAPAPPAPVAVVPVPVPLPPVVAALAPAPAPPPPLPPMVPLHVVVAYSGATGAAAQAVILAEALRRAGYQVPAPQMAAPRDLPAVSYAFAEDAPMADALAQATGLRATQGRAPVLARPGTVRVVLGPAPQRRDLELPPSGDPVP